MVADRLPPLLHVDHRREDQGTWMCSDSVLMLFENEPGQEILMAHFQEADWPTIDIPSRPRGPNGWPVTAYDSLGTDIFDYVRAWMPLPEMLKPLWEEGKQ